MYKRQVQATSQPLVVLHDFVVELFVSICTKKNRKEHPPQGDDASTAEADPGRVGRDEQGEAHRANSTPNGGPHLELGRLRLKTWSESDLSIAETTWSTYPYISLYHLCCIAHKRYSSCRQNERQLIDITVVRRVRPRAERWCDYEGHRRWKRAGRTLFCN